MLNEFKAFIARGNVLELAVGVLIGAAFGTVVTSFTEDLVSPLIASLFGKPDFSGFFLRLGPLPAGFAGDPASYAALKEAGVAVLGYGAFLTVVLNFLIVAFVLFLVIRAANRHFASLAPPTAPPGEEVLLLREIRDGLKRP
jgi:large conductance mechanosensitive channel